MYPSNANPYAAAGPLDAPISPVPSYRSSSQSSGVTSPSGHSIGSHPSWVNASVHSDHYSEPTSPRGSVVSVQRPPAPHDDNVNRYKSEIDTTRERLAHARANLLLDSTVGVEAKAAGVRYYRSNQDRQRESAATARAVALLGQSYNDEGDYEPSSSCAPQVPQLATTTRKKEEAQVASRREPNAPLPMVRRYGRENMAETSRPMPELTEEDVRDPETIAGMKDQLDIEREAKAMKRALFMLNHGCII